MGSLLIKNGTVITLGENNRIIKNGAVLVKDNFIQRIGCTDEFNDISPQTEVIDAKGKLIMPGFIKSTYAFSILLLPEGLPLSSHPQKIS